MRHLGKEWRPWLSLIVITIAACIPGTTATIQLGTGYGEADMGRVEKIIDQLGFTRIFVQPINGGRYPRTKHDGELVSGFETQSGATDAGFGASVHLRISDGNLRVVFAERNTRFSDRGMYLKEKLIYELRAIYGDKVSVDQ